MSIRSFRHLFTERLFDFQVSPSVSSRLYFASTSSIDSAEEQQVRSLRVPFLLSPLLSSPRPRVNYSRTCPADRRRRQRTFTSRAAFGRVCGIDAGETPLGRRRGHWRSRSSRSPLRGSDRLRSLRRNVRRAGRALPPSRLIPRSIPRTFPLLWTFTLDPGRSRDVSSFLFFCERSCRKKEIKGRKEEEIRSRNLRDLPSFLSFFRTKLNEFAINVNYSPSPRETLPRRGCFPRGCKTEFRKGRVLAELPPVRCRRRVATVVSSNARPASGLPVPSPSSRPSGTDYTQFTDLCYYRTVFHPLRPVLFIHPLASPFSRTPYFLGAQKGSVKLL